MTAIGAVILCLLAIAVKLIASCLVRIEARVTDDVVYRFPHGLKIWCPEDKHGKHWAITLIAGVRLCGWGASRDNALDDLMRTIANYTGFVVRHPDLAANQDVFERLVHVITNASLSEAIMRRVGSV